MRDVPADAVFLKNRILASLPQPEWDRLRSGMVPVRLVSGQILIEPNQGGDHAFFIEHGFACVLGASGEKSAQVAVIGNEGLVGGLGLLSGEPLPATTVMRVPGRALRIPLPLLRLRLDQCPSLRDAWLRYVHRLTSEIMQTATHNACSTLDQRCARWLLMAHSRVEGDDVPVTHEMMAGMLGVFRSGVTVAVSSLHDRGLIRSGRGRITVVDRAGLAEFAVRPLRQAPPETGAKVEINRPDLAIQG